MHTSRRRWADAGIALALFLATATGAALAWLDIWFQLFGDSADRADYETAARHLTGAAVGVLVLGSLVVVGLQRARWLLGWALVCAAALAVAAGQCIATASTMPPGDFGPSGWSEAPLALTLPPAWPLDILALVAAAAVVFRVVRRRQAITAR